MRLSEEDGNEAVLLRLARQLVEEISGRPFDPEHARIGPLATNYFSFVFPIELSNERGPRKVFVKIPKEDLRRGPKAILPISSADRRAAAAESESLRTLADQWRADDLAVSWVHLRAEIPDYNAIVTDAADGEEALTVFRRLDLRRRLGLAEDRDRLRAAMARLGTALGRFHLRAVAEGEFSPGLVAPKLLKYASEISKLTQSAWPNRVARIIEQCGSRRIPGLYTTTLKGLDVRNVLIDRDSRITLLDPGRMKRALREDDIARFLMTWRILYWGTGWFALGMEPDAAAENAFLKSYHEVMALPSSSELQDWFMLKEILKHWITAYIALSLKSWPPIIKRLVAAHYIDGFFELQLSKLKISGCSDSPDLAGSVVKAL